MRWRGFPAPGFDLDEIASSPNLEIHFVDSSGIISWNFLGDTPGFRILSTGISAPPPRKTTPGWSTRIHAEGHDIYIADFAHLGVYACRILVPGMSEIYPVDDLEWENNSVGNAIRPAILRLPDLSDDECAELLDTLNELGLDDQRPVAALIGLAADAGSFWSDLRVGELKTLLALADRRRRGDPRRLRMDAPFRAAGRRQRRRVYRCIESLLNLGDAAPYGAALQQPIWRGRRCGRHKPCSTGNSDFSACTRRGWRWKVATCTSACWRIRQGARSRGQPLKTGEFPRCRIRPAQHGQQTTQ